MNGMTFGGMAGLFGTMFILSVVPGPSVFAVMARSMASGFIHGLVTILGIVFANLIFILLAFFGMASIAESAGSFFVVVNYLGSGYLLWMGITMFRAKAKTVEVKGIEDLHGVPILFVVF